MEDNRRVSIQSMLDGSIYKTLYKRQRPSLFIPGEPLPFFLTS